MASGVWVSAARSGSILCAWLDGEATGVEGVSMTVSAGDVTSDLTSCSLEDWGVTGSEKIHCPRICSTVSACGCRVPVA